MLDARHCRNASVVHTTIRHHELRQKHHKNTALKLSQDISIAVSAKTYDKPEILVQQDQTHHHRVVCQTHQLEAFPTRQHDNQMNNSINKQSTAKYISSSSTTST